MHEIKVRRSGEVSRDVPSASERGECYSERPKKRPRRFFKSAISLLVVIVASTFLSTVMMHATNGVPFSESLLGLAFGTQDNERCPEGTVYVSSSGGSFCIDAYTASVGEKCPYLNPSSQSETGENLSLSECKPTSRPGALPWRYVSQTQAQTACSLAGKRLASTREWYEAAQGTPSGNRGPDGCNLYGLWPESPDRTGTGPECVSGVGSFDHVGNVWEWTDGVVRSGEIEGHTLPEPGYITSVDAHGFILSTDPDRPDSNYNGDRLWINPEGTRGVMRGGFFGSGTDGGVYSFHAEMTPDFAGRAVGFRCVKEL